MRKKLLLSLGVAGMLGLGSLAVVNAQTPTTDPDFETTVGKGVAGSTTINSGIKTIGTENDQGGNLINVIKKFINWILGILSLIVLVIVLVGGFQMVTASGNEEKYKKGFTILKHAGIGLVIIGLAWFIVTIVFRLLRNTTA